ncbi:MAG: hypothetical protein ACQKBT_11475 [Puniceicoccales bacterium]
MIPNKLIFTLSAASTFLLLSSPAATLIGTYEAIDGSTSYDLSTLGNLDWAYWNETGSSETGVATNSALGGTLISDISAYNGGSLRGTTSNRTTADFTYSNGTSPTSGSVYNSYGIFNNQLGSQGDGTEPGLALSILLPTAGITYEINIWGSEYYTSDSQDPADDTNNNGGIFTASLNGAADYVTDDFYGKNDKGSVVYTLFATADTDGDTVEITYVLPSDAYNSNAHVLFTAAAIAVPEPSSYAVFLGFSGLLLTLLRRRR